MWGVGPVSVGGGWSYGSAGEGLLRMEDMCDVNVLWVGL